METRSHDSAPDDAEVIAQVAALFADAERVVFAAPEVTDPAEIYHPTGPDCKVVSRKAIYGGSSVHMYSGMPEAQVEDTVDFGGGIGMLGGHSLPAKGARNRYDALVGRMLEANDLMGKTTTVAQRLIEIGGQPARVEVELTQRPRDGGLQTSEVGLSVYRDLPDGRSFKQYVFVCPPSDYNRAVTERDAIVAPEGYFDEEEDAARAVAVPSLPADPNFPADQPLGFDQMHQLLG